MRSPVAIWRGSGHYMESAEWRALYAAEPPGPLQYIMAIGVAALQGAMRG
jgi:hypothetical protein